MAKDHLTDDVQILAGDNVLATGSGSLTLTVRMRDKDTGLVQDCIFTFGPGRGNRPDTGTPGKHSDVALPPPAQ